MIDISKQYTTENGDAVKIYNTCGGGLYPVHGSVWNGSYWEPTTWTEAGMVRECSDEWDALVEVKPRIQREFWVNMYPLSQATHYTKDIADKAANQDRIACIKIKLDFEEGEGL
ncbi:hypothetical protein OAF54_00275 [bacterium]|nr:hypothetical protein [bacterium]